MIEFGPAPDRFVCALAAILFATLSFATVIVPAAI
jgi:hypothetical protein